MGRAIFISYRRDDSEGEAGRLFDDLVRAFGNDSVFMDVAGINPGTDFRKAIDDNVATCGVLLAVMGPRWVTITDSSNQRRLDDENDFVRLETASALARNIPVIPVLVHDAKMPRPEQLPDNLKDLAYRNSVEITHARWNSDVQLLTAALKQYVGSSSQTDTEPVHATVPVQLPPPNAPATAPAGRPKMSKAPLIGGLAVAVLLIASVAFFALRHSRRADSEPVPAATMTGQPPAAASTNPSAAVAGAAGAPIAGVWTNPSPAGRNGLAKLEITGGGSQLSVHAWGDCPGCDWGVQTATVDGQNATAVWTLTQPMGAEEAGRVATVTIRPSGRGSLAVSVANTFPHHAPNQRRSEFVRAQ